jgi:soluble lytic murein transglycosylase
VQSDPTGYYSERARDVLLSRSPFNASSVFDLGFDLENEKREAETWLRNTFSVPAETALSGFGNLAGDARLQRGDALWQVGLYREASLEFDAIRAQYLQDPVVNFLLVDYFVKLGAYRQAIVASRQILDLVHMENASTLDAPIYFTHIRFGPYYKDLVLPAAQNEGFHPLFLFSVIRQESLFEGHIQSSAGAGGLMQLIPDTAREVVSELEWPKNYTDSDRFRPLINIPLGAHYLAHQRDAFDGNITFALAAYNAGPGNALAWQNVVQGDSDLFLEVIRFDETRLYIKQIAEFMYIYRRVYERAS